MGGQNLLQMAQYLMGTLNKARQISQNHPPCFCIVSYLRHTKIGCNRCEGVRRYLWRSSAHVNILSETCCRCKTEGQTHLCPPCSGSGSA